MEHDIMAQDCEGKEAKPLSAAAVRALAEAKARRLIENSVVERQEIGGRGGQDPARYGDWEVKGRAIDF